jgi:putative ABC transport system permease protein
VIRWRVFAARLREFLSRGRVERDLTDELQAHLDFLTDEHVRRGLGRDDARRAARRDLGGLEQTRELVRDRRGFRGLETFAQDVRRGARMLAKSPGFTLSAVLMLGLGIGANTAVFSVVDAVLLRPLPYPSADRLVSVWEVLQPQGTRIAVAPANYVDYVRRTRAFSRVMTFETGGRNLTDHGTPERLVIEEVTASYFGTLGMMPALGRPFDSAENAEGSQFVAVITHAFWHRRFAGDPNVLERTITLNNRAHRIVGVMPPEFRAPSDAGPQDPVSVVVPAVFDAELLANRNDHRVQVVARLAPGISVDAARADLDAVSEALARDFPESANVRAALAPLGDDQAREVQTLLWLLLGGVGLVLLVACANIAGLILVRSIDRQREIAVRFALGATRRRVVSELLTQHLLLAGAGAAAGLAMAVWTTNVLVSLAPATFPHVREAAVDGRVLVFTAALGLATGVLFGMLPAWRVSRTKPIEVLRSTDRAAAPRGASARRHALMAAEVALSTLLLVMLACMAQLAMINAVLLRRAERATQRRAHGAPSLPGPARVRGSGRVKAIPGVQHVTLRPPCCAAIIERFLARIARAHGADGPGRRVPVVNLSTRRPQDPAQADACYDGGSGRRARRRAGERGVQPRIFGGASRSAGATRAGLPWITIVGVVADIRRGGRLADIEAQVYLPAPQIELYPLPLSDLALRVEREPRGLAEAVMNAIWAIDPNQPVTNVRTLDEVLALRLAERRFQTFLFSLFAALAITLALVSVYSVVDYTVRQRSGEIGLRLALGADSAGILRWLLGQSLALAVAGTVAGIAAAAWLSRYVRTLLFGIEPIDAVTYIGAALVLLCATLAAGALAARRATRVDPAVALK